MAVTILEALQNAEFNFKSNNSFSRAVGMEQLNNAIMLLDKGYSIHDEVEPLLEKYGDVENVSNKEESS